MNHEMMNAEIESLIQTMEEIGERPSYTKGGSYNDYLEYGRLKSIIAEKCIQAFKMGLHFGAEGTP